MEQLKGALEERRKYWSRGGLFSVTPTEEAHLIQVTYSIFIATLYMTTQDSLKVTNRDVHQVE